MNAGVLRWKRINPTKGSFKFSAKDKLKRFLWGEIRSWTITGSGFTSHDRVGEEVLIGVAALNCAFRNLERNGGFEPPPPAWQASILPLK